MAKQRWPRWPRGRRELSGARHARCHGDGDHDVGRSLRAGHLGNNWRRSWIADVELRAKHRGRCRRGFDGEGRHDATCPAGRSRHRDAERPVACTRTCTRATSRAAAIRGRAVPSGGVTTARSKTCHLHHRLRGLHANALTLCGVRGGGDCEPALRASPAGQPAHLAVRVGAFGRDEVTPQQRGNVLTKRTRTHWERQRTSG
jgi:hypothetical protein